MSTSAGRPTYVSCAAAAATLLLLALLVVALAQFPSVHLTYWEDSRLDVPPGDVAVDVDCGSVLRSGPETVEQGGWFASWPCDGAIARQRRTAGGLACAALATGLLTWWSSRRSRRDRAVTEDDATTSPVVGFGPGR